MGYFWMGFLDCFGGFLNGLAMEKGQALYCKVALELQRRNFGVVSGNGG